MKSILFATAVAALLATGCGKKNDGHPEPANKCRILTVTSSSGASSEQTDFSYNNDGKILLLKSNDFYKTRLTFNYAGNTLITERFYGHWNDQRVSRSTITLNGAGWPVKVITESYSHVGKPDLMTERVTITNEYNGNNQILKSEKSVLNTITFVEIKSSSLFTWANGNLVKLTYSDKPNSWDEIEYYTDKPWQPAEPLYLRNIAEYGLRIYNTTHLVKAMRTMERKADGSVAPMAIANLDYTMSADGKITSYALSLTGAPTRSENNIQYQCP